MVVKSTTKSASLAPHKAHQRTDRRTRRVNRTRLRLMEAARAVFAEKGLDLATINNITERADVGKGTFYYHFHNKGELVRELIRDLMAELAEAIRTRVNSTAELQRVLESIIQAHIDFFKGRWEHYVIYFLCRADFILEEGYEGTKSPFVDYLTCIENAVDSAIQRRVPPANLRRIACAIAGFVSGYYSFALIDMKSSQIEQSVQVMRGALVTGLAEFINEAVS